MVKAGQRLSISAQKISVNFQPDLQLYRNICRRPGTTPRLHCMSLGWSDSVQALILQCSSPMCRRSTCQLTFISGFCIRGPQQLHHICQDVYIVMPNVIGTSYPHLRVPYWLVLVVGFIFVWCDALLDGNLYVPSYLNLCSFLWISVG